MKYNIQVNSKGMIPKAASEDIRKELLHYANKRITLTIEKYYKQRTSQQNRYLFGVAYKLISDHTGYTPDEVHDLLAKKFIGKKTIKIGSETVETHETSTKLSTTDFMAYIASVQRFAAEELDVYIPDPEYNY